MKEKLENIEKGKELIAREGEKSYLSEYVSSKSIWEKIGQGLSCSNFGNVRGILSLAYEFLEDCNAHNLCALLDWATNHGLYNGSENFYDWDLEHISKLVEKSNIEIKGWYETGKGYKTRKCNVKVVVEWLD